MRKVAPKMGQDGNKMAQDGPRWQQDAHLGLNLGGLGPILASTCPILGGPGADFGSVLEHFARCGEHAKTLEKLQFL